MTKQSAIKIPDNSQNTGKPSVNFTRLILTHIKRHISAIYKAWYFRVWVSLVSAGIQLIATLYIKLNLSFIGSGRSHKKKKNNYE